MSIIKDLEALGTNVELALARVMQHYGARTGTVHRLEADGQLHLIAWAGDIPRHLLPVIETIEVGKGIAGLTVERNEPVNMCNLQTDSSGQARPGARAIAAKGSICVPMRREGAVAGALGIAMSEERVFGDDEVTELLELATVIAVSL